MKTYSLIPALFLCLPLTAHAEPYLSGQVGTSSSIVDDKQGEHGQTARIAAGYKWKVTKKIKLGLESGFSLFEKTYSSAEYQPATMWYSKPANTYLVEGNVNKHNIDLLAVFDFHVTEKFALFLKAGEGFQKRTYKSLSNTASSTTTSAMGFRMGFGLGYDIIKDLNINLEYAHEEGKNSYFINKATPSFGTLLLGLQYQINKKKTV